MAVVERLRAFYRKAGWPERILAVLLAVYIVVIWTAPGNVARPLAGIALTLTGLWVAIRWTRRGIRSAVWRLRNRLVVAYLFIAVVPIVLILALASIGAYILTGQIAVYLIASAIDRRTESLAVSAQELLSSSPADRADYMRWLATSLSDRYSGVSVLYRGDGQSQHPAAPPIAFPAPGHRDTHGLILRESRPYLWAHAVRSPAEALILAPLTRQVLDGLAPDLAEVTLLTGRSGTLPSSPGVPGQARGGKIPLRQGWYDIQVLWVSIMPVARWEQPGTGGFVPVGVVSRPSAVLNALFSERISTRGIWVWFFLIIAVLFLVFEIIALAIGVSLTRTITGAVHGLYEGTRRVMRGDFSHRIEVRGNDQLADLGHSFNRMTENLERLLRIEKEQERLQAELEIAREVQSQLFPKIVPTVPGLEITARCSPARTVSGDYYDYLGLDGSRVALAIGDVAGKGISAALLMATVQSSLRTQLRNLPGEPAAAAHLVGQLNQHLYSYTSAEKFATFYFGLYDAGSGALIYTNAGHPPPIVIRDGCAVRLETNGIVVGAFPFAEYGESRIDLERGDLLVCFTDGITEPENEYGEMFGEDRLIELLVRHSSESLPGIMDTVYSAVRQWSSSVEGQDDMTMLVARRTSN